MKLLFIRHAEPDYVHDSLTEKGFREAELLSEMMKDIHVDYFYASPLGRAKKTLEPTLEKKGATATECKWLREFDPRIDRPDTTSRKTVAWDWLPQDWCNYDDFYSYDKWMNHPVYKNSDVYSEYLWVTGSFDELMKNHGYVREGRTYRVEQPNNDTIAFFSHFGVSGVILSHLFSISPLIPWHHFVALPSSVTTVVSEERRPGVASFRMISYGATPHLFVHSEEPSNSARFCECYTNMEERHD